jgi:predicted transcriptional regulator of viral defense system
LCYTLQAAINHRVFIGQKRRRKMSSSKGEASNQIIFVSGERLTYDLSQDEQKILLSEIEVKGYKQLSNGVYWVPDLDLVETSAYLTN